MVWGGLVPAGTKMERPLAKQQVCQPLWQLSDCFTSTGIAAALVRHPNQRRHNQGRPVTHSHNSVVLISTPRGRQSASHARGLIGDGPVALPLCMTVGGWHVGRCRGWQDLCDLPSAGIAGSRVRPRRWPWCRCGVAVVSWGIGIRFAVITLCSWSDVAPAKTADERLAGNIRQGLRR